MDGHSLVRRQLDPGRDASVVVERGRHDLVACREVAARRAGEREVERRHVHPERDLRGGAAEEPRRILLGAFEDRFDRPARGVWSAKVAGRIAQRTRDRVADLVGHLRPARRIEEREAEAESREARPRSLDVEDADRHELTWLPRSTWRRYRWPSGVSRR